MTSLVAAVAACDAVVVDVVVVAPLAPNFARRYRLAL
jgi:hypothetical protein